MWKDFASRITNRKSLALIHGQVGQHDSGVGHLFYFVGVIDDGARLDYQVAVSCAEKDGGALIFCQTPHVNERQRRRLRRRWRRRRWQRDSGSSGRQTL